jgi:uncharacterized protein YlxW (UPF0749 family)
MKPYILVATLIMMCLGVLLPVQLHSQRSIDLAERIQQERLLQIQTVMDSLQESNTFLADENKKLAAELENMRDQGGASPQLIAQLDQMRILDGTSQVQGLGVKMVIADNGPDIAVQYPIATDDLRRLINTLRFAGAEGISINGQRIVASTSIVLSGSSTILINSVPINRIGNLTYEVLAVGDPDTLTDYLNKLEVLSMRQAGMKVELTKETVTLPSYRGGYYFNYGDPVGI